MRFKSDQSFLKFLTMGAIASTKTAADLSIRGHRIIELERYTTSNKIWAEKVKRLRLPDLLCLNCGLRVEARGKSTLEIKVSDSPSNPNRQWTAGLEDDDLFAFLQVSFAGSVATAASWVEYFRIADLRATEHLSRLGPPKSAGEGAERDRSWPSYTPSFDGSVLAVSPTHVVMQSTGGSMRRQPLQRKAGPSQLAYVAQGDSFEGGKRLVSGVVPKPSTLSCPGDRWDPLGRLQATRPGVDPARVSADYTAIKALGFRGDSNAAATLLAGTWRDPNADYRIRLEALAGLARRLPDTWITTLGAQVLDAPSLDMQMEAAFILSELRFAGAAGELAKALVRGDLPEEVRAAAAWGLGVCGHYRPELLLGYLGDTSDTVAVHSLVAMGSDFSRELLERAGSLLEHGDRAAAAAVHLLTRHQDTGQAATVLLRRLQESTTARASAWALYGLALLGREKVEAGSGPLDPAIARQIEQISIGLTLDWLLTERASEPEVLDFIGRQTVRDAVRLSAG